MQGGKCLGLHLTRFNCEIKWNALHSRGQGAEHLYMSTCGSYRQSRRRNSNQSRRHSSISLSMIAYYEYMRSISEGDYCGVRLVGKIIACHVWGIAFYA
jgi:hypothetical protein